MKSSESKASAVTDRIAAVEDVAARLFDEWEGELDDYSSERLRASSEQKLRQTRSRYTQLIGAMKRAEGKIEPVLKVFRDNVLYLKHNLNAQAIASLKDELVAVETNIADLVREMEASVAEANEFISVVSDPET